MKFKFIPIPHLPIRHLPIFSMPNPQHLKNFHFFIIKMQYFVTMPTEEDALRPTSHDQ